jgi:hypothetical protein
MFSPRGLPAVESRWHAPLTRDKQINRFSRVVVSLQQRISNAHLAAVGMAMRRLLGGRESLSRFEATHFRDFIWRMLFARTLPYENFDAVTCADFRVARVPWTAMHRCALISPGSLATRCTLASTLSDYDVMIVETPYPAIVSPLTRLVVRYHDAIPLLMPHTISDKVYHQASHYYALRNNVSRGGFFSCVSDATRKRPSLDLPAGRIALGDHIQYGLAPLLPGRVVACAHPRDHRHQTE